MQSMRLDRYGIGAFPIEIDYELLKREAYYCALNYMNVYINSIINYDIHNYIQNNFYLDYSILVVFLMSYHGIEKKNCKMFSKYCDQIVKNIKFDLKKDFFFENNTYNNWINDVTHIRNFLSSLEDLYVSKNSHSSCLPITRGSINRLDQAVKYFKMEYKYNIVFFKKEIEKCLDFFIVNDKENINEIIKKNIFNYYSANKDFSLSRVSEGISRSNIQMESLGLNKKK